MTIFIVMNKDELVTAFLDPNRAHDMVKNSVEGYHVKPIFVQDSKDIPK